jgi:multiple sugar transport system substrate-binding protein
MPARRAGAGRRAAFAALVALAAASGCAPRPRPPVELVFRSARPAEALAPLLRRFEAEEPGLRVRLEALPAAAARDTLAAALAAGRTPDLCEVSSSDMPALLASGALTDWSAGVASLRDSLRGWELCSVGDAVYGLPWLLDVRALHWDRALFARAGLDTTRAPATWDEVRRAAAAIERLGRGVHGYGVSAADRGRMFARVMPYAWGAGGALLSAGLDSARVDSPANREALEFILSLRGAGLVGMEDELDRAFLEGRLGMHVAGAGLRARLTAAAARRAGVALVPRPAADRGEHASFADGSVLVSFATSRRKPEAQRLARFLVRPEHAIGLARSLAVVQPSCAGTDTSAAYRDDPVGRVFVVQLATARFAPPHRDWVAMQADLEDEIEQALHGRKSAAQALADADARIAARLGRR